ncbi:MAG: HdeD family acid-resistance protein [Lachnospira sp.]
MGSIYKKLKTVKYEIMIVAAALFLLGLFLVLFPALSQEIICKGIGVALCVWGVLRLITYFRVAGNEILGSYGLVQGVTLLAFGFFFVVKPEIITVFLGTALAVIIIVDGILKLQYAVDFYHLQADKWWIELIGAVIMIIVGVVALFNPFSTTEALTIFIGIALMIEGIWDFISLMKIVSVAKKAGKVLSDMKDRADAVDMK